MSVLAHLAASDFRLSGRLLAWTPPHWFRIWMVSANRVADGWLWGAVALLLVSAGTQGHRVLAGAALSAGLANIALVLLKDRVRRPRPCDGALPRTVKAPRPYFPSDRYSFPSGHAVNAFAVGSVLLLSFPVLAGVVLAVALSVAASRVVLGQHFLSDVVAGAVLGGVIGASVYLSWLR